MVREQVCPGQAHAIGLRLGADAARKLRNPDELKIFQKWLDEKNCYVFTINGFPYGAFHGTRVKEQVYRPIGPLQIGRNTPFCYLKFLKPCYSPDRKGA